LDEGEEEEQEEDAGEMKWSAQRRRVSHMAQDGALSRAMDGEGQLSLLFSLIRGPGVNQRSSAHTCYY